MNQVLSDIMWFGLKNNIKSRTITTEGQIDPLQWAFDLLSFEKNIYKYYTIIEKIILKKTHIFPVIYMQCF